MLSTCTVLELWSNDSSQRVAAWLSLIWLMRYVWPTTRQTIRSVGPSHDNTTQWLCICRYSCRRQNITRTSNYVVSTLQSCLCEAHPLLKHVWSQKRPTLHLEHRLVAPILPQNPQIFCPSCGETLAVFAGASSVLTSLLDFFFSELRSFFSKRVASNNFWFFSAISLVSWSDASSSWSLFMYFSWTFNVCWWSKASQVCTKSARDLSFGISIFPRKKQPIYPISSHLQIKIESTPYVNPLALSTIFNTCSIVSLSWNTNSLSWLCCWPPGQM